MRSGYLFVLMAGILSGTIVFGGKVFSNYGLSAYALAVFPYLIPVVVLLPLVLSKKKYALRAKDLPLWLLYGIVCALLALSQFSAVILGVPVAIVVLLLYSQPIWAVLFTHLFMKEKITARDVLTCVLVLIGVVVLVNPFGVKIENWTGVFIALLGGMLLAAWIVIGSYASKKKINPVTIKFAESLFQIIFLFALYPLAYFIFRNPQITSFSFPLTLPIIMGIILFGLISQTLNHILLFKGAQKVPTVHVSIILLLEPVVATLLAYIFLKQAITLNVVIGGLVIIAANALVVKKS